MKCTGVASHNEIEVFIFAISHEIPKFFWWRRMLGILGKVFRTYNQAMFCSFLITFYKNCYQVHTTESW